MERLLTYFFIWLFVEDKDRIKRAMKILFDNEDTEAKPKVGVREPKPVNGKRDEIISAINYLKGKKNKTKADKDKLQMLEVILSSPAYR